MTPAHPTAIASIQPVLSNDSLLQVPFSISYPAFVETGHFAHTVANPLPRFNASYAVVFVRDGAKKRRDLAYARARDLQRELGVAPGLQCVPSLP